MTKEEFETRYALRSGLTVDQMYDLGLYPDLCNCNDDGCQGWQMMHISAADDALA